VKLAQKHLRPAKELATPPPQQRKNELKKKDTELQARRKALSRRADEFISGLTSKAVVSAVDSPRQQESIRSSSSMNYGGNMALESRLGEIAISIRELQEWSLRLSGRKEVEAISKSLGHAVVGFMHALQLYMTRPRNVEIVSATLLELRRSLQGPLELFEQFQVATSKWWRQTSRKYVLLNSQHSLNTLKSWTSKYLKY
jgi:hypothetical protein